MAKEAVADKANKDIVALSDFEHVLHRPTMYIGSVEKSEDRDSGPGWSDRRSGSGLVHRSILCTVFPDPDLESRWRIGQLADRGFAADRHTIFCGVRYLVGQDRS